MPRTAPGYIEDTLERIDEFVTPLAQAGVTTFGMGGHRRVTLAQMRALARVHGTARDGATGLAHRPVGELLRLRPLALLNHVSARD